MCIVESTQTTAPTAEPVSLTEAKLHLRVDHDEEDSLILGLIVAAREYAEMVTNRQLVTATWTAKLDYFPAYELRLPHPPLASVTSIAYVDSQGTSQTLSASLYSVDTTSKPGMVTPIYGETWPAVQGQHHAVTIVYVAGHGGPESVPDGIKKAMLMSVGHWYENREAVVFGGPAEVPMAVDALLSPFKVGWLW